MLQSVTDAIRAKRIFLRARTDDWTRALGIVLYHLASLSRHQPRADGLPGKEPRGREGVVLQGEGALSGGVQA